MSVRRPSIITRLHWIGALLVCIAIGGPAALYLTLKQSDALIGDVIRVAEPLQEAALEIEIHTIGVTLSVVQYMDNPTPLARQRFEEGADEISRFLQKLRELPLEQAEAGTLREIGRRFAEMRGLGEEMIARQDQITGLQRSASSGAEDELTLLRDAQTRDRHELFEKHQRLNVLLDRGIQILAAEGVSDASQSADTMIHRVSQLVLVLAFLFGLTCFVATVAIARRLIQPLRAMVVGANAFAQGDFSHKIQHQGMDEIGHVITTLNEMAGSLSDSQSSMENRVVTRTSELDAAKRVLETTLASIEDAVVAIDSTGRVQFMNRSAERLAGKTQDRARGNLWQEVLPLVDQATGDYVGRLEGDGEHSDGQGVYTNWCVLDQDGELRDVDVSIGNIADAAGKTQGSVLVMRNAEQTRQLQRRLAHQVDHDTLTELPNRVMFGRELERCLARASRQGNEVAVLFMDLDGFKEVNDVHGHAIGDEVLILVSQRLRAIMRPMDLIARLSGDEFCLAVAHPKGGFPFELADRILQTLASPYEVNSLLLSLSVSVGIARYPQDGLERTALMRHADAAMYEAKKAGKSRYMLHDGKIRERAEARAAIVEGLRDALKHGGFELYYQPQVALENGAFKGVEALLRWRRGRDLVLPGEFLEIADDAGLMPEIDQWVVTNACAQLRQWEESGFRFRLAINVTGEGLRRNLVSELEEALRNHALDPELIEIEITESRLLEDEPVLAAVRRLREVGVRVAIDDFGTGYSSFGALRELPVDSLKIDRSFVHAIEIQPRHAAIVSAIMRTAHVIGLEVTAEGIEARAQANLLLSLGCMTGQGYYFSRPVPAAEIPSIVHRLGVDSAGKMPEFLPRTA